MRKYKLISVLAEETAKEVVRNEENWRRHLNTASLPLETGAMGLNDRMGFMNIFQKQINDMKLLSQKRTAAYYQYSMQASQSYFYNVKSVAKSHRLIL